MLVQSNDRMNDIFCLKKNAREASSVSKLEAMRKVSNVRDRPPSRLPLHTRVLGQLFASLGCVLKRNLSAAGSTGQSESKSLRLMSA